MFHSKKIIVSAFIVIILSSLISCGGGNENSLSTLPSLTPVIPSPDNQNIKLNFTFNSDTNGWIAGFSDYPVADELIFKLSSNHEEVPPPLQTKSGFRLEGTNRSDDLFMYIKKGFSGFSPQTTYKLEFEITFATDAQNCLGAGGSPGGSVSIKSGASIIEPASVISEGIEYRMNIDKGIQKNSGANAVRLGDFANSQACDPNNQLYELKTLNNINQLDKRLEILTDSSGVLWFIFATDSGFESTTKIYFIEGVIIASKL